LRQARDALRDGPRRILALDMTGERTYGWE